MVFFKVTGVTVSARAIEFLYDSMTRYITVVLAARGGGSKYESLRIYSPKFPEN